MQSKVVRSRKKTPKRSRLAQYHRDRRQLAKRLNKCAWCHGPRAIKAPSSLCRECTYRKIAAKHLGSAKKWEQIKKFWLARGGRCAYTGRRIGIGKGASIDHVKPRSRHPHLAEDIDNLRWVDTRVNIAKRNMSLTEFVQLCIDVVRHFYSINDD